MEHTVHSNIRLANPNPNPNPNRNQVCSDLLYNAELAGEVGRGRREGAHKATKPPRPAGVSREEPLPEVRSCNYAFLVTMDREIRRREAAAAGSSQTLDPTTVTFSKDELMRMVSSDGGELCKVDVYDDRAVASTQAGTYGYDGWATLEWECCFKDAAQGAEEGAPFIAAHIIIPPEKAFDDFAGGDVDMAAVRSVLGLS